MAMITAGGSVQAGSTDCSITVELRNTSDNLEATGKVASGFNVRYWRPLNAPANVSPLTDLAAVTTAHADGGIKELDATNMKGQYRIDLPDAAFATGAPYVLVTVQVAGCWTASREYPIMAVDAPWSLSTASLNAIADTVLKRDWNAITGEASRSLLNAARFLRNRWRIPPSSTTMTVYKEDDSTAAWTSTVEPSATASSVIGSDPA